MDSECLEEQFKNLQLERGREAISESWGGEKSRGPSDVLPSDRASLHASPFLPPFAADRERRKSEGVNVGAKLSGASTWRPGGAAAVVAVVTREREVGWVGGDWFVGRVVGMFRCRCFLEMNVARCPRAIARVALERRRAMVP